MLCSKHESSGHLFFPVTMVSMHGGCFAFDIDTNFSSVSDMCSRLFDFPGV
jgi:hypothetical protein